MMSTEVTEMICVDPVGDYIFCYFLSLVEGTNPGLDRELMAISTGPASGAQLRKMTTWL